MELLRAEHARAMDLVAEEKQAVVELAANAEQKLRRVDEAEKVLAERERELRRVVEAAEEQVHDWWQTMRIDKQ
jgi:hypothetical protein